MRRHCGCVLALLSISFPVLAQTSVDAVMWEGDAVLGPGISVESLFQPRVSSYGEVVFGAFLTGGGVSTSDDGTLWAGGGGVPQLICREGYAYPPAGANVTGLCPGSGAVANAVPAGELRVFGADQISGDGVTTANNSIRTMLVGTASSSVMVAREGNTAPETAGSYIAMFGENRVNGGGLVAFNSALTGGSTTSGIWAGPPSSVSLFVKAGDPAGGLSGTLEGFSSLALSRSGYLAFRGYTTGGEYGLFSGLATGGPSLVAGTGSAAPGGGYFQDVMQHAINRTGEIVLKGYLQSGSYGIWAADLIGLRAVALQGTPAPDYGTFAAFGTPSIGGKGDICFFAYLVSGADGLYCEIDDVLQVVVREDDTLPALAPGEMVGDLLWMPVVNTHGQVLFFSQVQDAAGFDVTIWMRDTLGELILIARASDPLEVSPGVFKTVYTIDTPTGEYLGGIGSGDATVFNDRGEVVFLADFTDGSEGIFVAQPEPFETGHIFADGFESGDTTRWSSATN